MKLKEFLENINLDQKVQLLLYEDDNSEEILYEGEVWNVSWRYVDWLLDTNNIGEAIYAFIMNNEAWIAIYIKEE
jgi:hypothetical protein